MKIKITRIDKSQQEYLEIFCHSESGAVRDIIGFVQSREGSLTGYDDDRRCPVPITEIYYIEAVDNRLFIYTKDKTYESRAKLYELEEALRGKRFLRASKQTLLNLMKINSVKPALNGRFAALLMNGEQVIISRKYVPDLKKALIGGE